MRTHPVKVHGHPKDWSKISPTLTPGFEGFELHDAGALLATCGNARALSQWALDKGAVCVRWDFNLKLADQ